MKDSPRIVDLAKLERISKLGIPLGTNFLEILNFEETSKGSGYGIKSENLIAKITEVFYDPDEPTESRIDSPEFVKKFYKTVHEQIAFYGLKNVKDDDVSTFFYDERTTFGVFAFNMNESFRNPSELMLMSVFAGKLYKLRASFFSDISKETKEILIRAILSCRFDTLLDILNIIWGIEIPNYKYKE